MAREELKGEGEEGAAAAEAEEEGQVLFSSQSQEGEEDSHGLAGHHHLHHADHVPAPFVLPPCYRPRSDAASVLGEVPLIDLSPLLRQQGQGDIDATIAADGPRARGKASVLSQIHNACRDWGFFQVLNHGVSLQALECIHRGFLDFLKLPLADKCARAGFVKGDNGQGFGSAFFNPQIGTAEWRDYLVFATFPESAKKDSQWPPLIKDSLGTFSAEVLELARCLLAALSENLHLPASYIEEAMQGLNQKVLISHYPPCPQPDLAVGACEHTDVGAITFVWEASEDVAGLQVCKDGKWHTIEPIHGALVVNVADQVEIISNGLYKSGRHRVVLNSSKSRISVVAFHNPSATAEVSPAPSLIDCDHPALFEATQFRSYAATFAIRAE